MLISEGKIVKAARPRSEPIAVRVGKKIGKDARLRSKPILVPVGNIIVEDARLRSELNALQVGSQIAARGSSRPFAQRVSIEIGKDARPRSDTIAVRLDLLGKKIVEDARPRSALAAIRMANDDNKKSHFTILKIFFATLGLAVLFFISTFFYVLNSILEAWRNQLLLHVITH